VIPVDERVVIPSINRGVPFMLGDKSRPISRAVLDLTEVVRGRLVELSQADVEETTRKGTNPLKRLGKR
jgi:septum formation inhibitor-activating ATPase MinD